MNPQVLLKQLLQNKHSALNIIPKTNFISKIFLDQ
jgi:hypothetical protein